MFWVFNVGDEEAGQYHDLRQISNRRAGMKSDHWSACRRARTGGLSSLGVLMPSATDTRPTDGHGAISVVSASGPAIGADDALALRWWGS
jgi:hypothetical protein